MSNETREKLTFVRTFSRRRRGKSANAKPDILLKNGENNKGEANKASPFFEKSDTECDAVFCFALR